MAIARNGEVELYYETFGSPEDPTLLLVNGLGSQCINYEVPWCERFVAEGFRVVRFDNRDVGLSSKVAGEPYALADMALDAVAVLDALDVERAHVMGLSMGGMIVQRLAIDHPDRLLTMTSVMSRTGEPGFGESASRRAGRAHRAARRIAGRVHRRPRGRHRHLRVHARLDRGGGPPGPSGRGL